jgi:cobaltochelatase CobN
VPVEWLKEEWRRRGLLKRVQLTISGCVGPCDVPNVVVVVGSRGTEWLGNITEFAQYQALVSWATRSKEAGGLLALPSEFDGHKFDPFPDTH